MLRSFPIFGNIWLEHMRANCIHNITKLSTNSINNKLLFSSGSTEIYACLLDTIACDGSFLKCFYFSLPFTTFKHRAFMYTILYHKYFFLKYVFKSINMMDAPSNMINYHKSINKLGYSFEKSFRLYYYFKHMYTKVLFLRTKEPH